MDGVFIETPHNFESFHREDKHRGYNRQLQHPTGCGTAMTTTMTMNEINVQPPTPN